MADSADSPLNLAHSYAHSADDYASRELWHKAMDAHYRAAQAFEDAGRRVTDPDTTRTLQMLAQNHARQGKELQRKVAQMHREPGARPPQQQHRRRETIPPAASASAAAATGPSRLARVPEASSDGSGKNRVSRREGTYSASSAPHVSYPFSSLPPPAHQAPFPPTASPTSSSPRSSRSLAASRQRALHDSASSSEPTVDESYMLLRPDSDPSDPFNRFWAIVEGMVEQISNPVAFATAPLDGEHDWQRQHPVRPSSPPPAKPSSPQSPHSSFELVKPTTSDPHPHPHPHPPAPSSTTSRRTSLLSTATALFLGSSPYPSDAEVEAEHRSAVARRSNFPSRSPSGKTLEELSLENAQLKATVDGMACRLLEYEKRDRAHEALKGSILKFGSDVRKEAQRMMAASQEMRKSTMRAPQQPSPVSASSAHMPEASMPPSSSVQARIRQLEDELRAVKLENEKQKVLLGKYKDRWEKLKESAAKRRKAAQEAAAQAATIPEEGEGAGGGTG